MNQLIISFSLLLLTACASTTSDIQMPSEEVAQNISNEKLTVIFIDSNKTLKYIVEIYEVLNTTERKLSTSYRNEWESDAILTDLHTREFAKQGFKVRMFTEIFSKKDLKKVELMYQQYLKESKINPELKLTLTPEVQELLKDRRIEYLVLIDWTDFTLFIKSKGQAAEEFTTTNYKILNRKTGNIVWQGSIQAKLSLDLKDKDGKIYLEENNLAQFKFEVKRLIRSQYTRNKDNLWQLMGLDKQLEN